MAKCLKMDCCICTTGSKIPTPKSCSTEIRDLKVFFPSSTI